MGGGGGGGGSGCCYGGGGCIATFSPKFNTRWK